MSESAPPPPAASLRGHLAQAARNARFLATILVTVISARFTVAGADHALGVSGGNFSRKPVPHANPSPFGSEARAVPSADRAGHSRAVAAPSGSAVSAGRSLRVTLGVNYGDPRSEVYVNGSLVGQTPFLGDTSCKSGQQLRIEIVPRVGLPLTYLRGCRGGSLELNGPPP